MAERPLDCSAVRGIKIWNQLVLCLQTLTSAGRENQLRKLKVEAATRKSFSTSSSAFISARVQLLRTTEDQMGPLSCLLRRGSSRGDFAGKVSDLWTLSLHGNGLPGAPESPCYLEHSQKCTCPEIEMQPQLYSYTVNPQYQKCFFMYIKYSCVKPQQKCYQTKMAGCCVYTSNFELLKL